MLGPVDDADFAALWDHDILAAMGRFDQLERVAQMAEERGEVRVGLKFDTGMRRLGFRPEDVPEVIEFFRSNPKVVPVMATSHLALADEPENVAAVNGQAENFRQRLTHCAGPVSRSKPTCPIPPGPSPMSGATTTAFVWALPSMDAIRFMIPSGREGAANCAPPWMCPLRSCMCTA